MERKSQSANNTPDTSRSPLVKPTTGLSTSAGNTKDKLRVRSASTSVATGQLKASEEKDEGNYTWGWGEFPEPKAESPIATRSTSLDENSQPTPVAITSSSGLSSSDPSNKSSGQSMTGQEISQPEQQMTRDGKPAGKWKFGFSFLNMFKGNRQSNSSNSIDKSKSGKPTSDAKLMLEEDEREEEEDEATTEYFSEDEDEVSDEEVKKAFDEPIFNMDDSHTVGNDEQQEEDKTKRKRRVDKRSQEADAPYHRDRRKRFDVELSRCGSLLFDPDFDKQKTAEVFSRHKLTHRDVTQILLKDALGLFDKDIVFRIQGNYYPWSVAGPMMVSILAFGKNLSGEALHNLLRENNLLEEEESSTGWASFWPWTKQQQQQQRKRSLSTVPEKNSPSGSTSPLTNPITTTTTTTTTTTNTTTTFTTAIGTTIPPASPPLEVIPSSPRSIPTTKSSSPSSPVNINTLATTTAPTTPEPGKYYTRTLKPTSKQLEEMNLKSGTNTVTFSVTCAIRGKQDVTTTLYLWEKDDTIVISDIDGTITKSDVFGQILPVVFNQDWSQEGVAQLYSNITANGYRILYLTARAIGQASVTKEFLTTLRQEQGTQEVRLPPGPVFMSPDRLLYSINREVIIRKPEQFKIACLNDIKDLFGNRDCPFYAGFGNRHSDAVSYRRVGISEAKIFIINHFGEVTCASGAYTKTYTKINELVDEMFPPLNQKKLHVEEQWSDGQYWSPRREYNLDDLEKELQTKKS